jgi:hypothetical protein
VQRDATWIQAQVAELQSCVRPFFPPFLVLLSSLVVAAAVAAVVAGFLLVLGERSKVEEGEVLALSGGR